MQSKLDYIELLYLASPEILEHSKAFALKLIKNQNDKMLLSLKKLSLFPNEIFVYTLYMQKDVPIPKRYNCIYDIEQDSFIKVDFKITFCLENFHFPSDKLIQGNRYSIVLTFDSDIPDKMKKLEKYELNKGENLNLVLCNFEDLKDVQKEISVIKEERRKYKQKWQNQGC